LEAKETISFLWNWYSERLFQPKKQHERSSEKKEGLAYPINLCAGRLPIQNKSGGARNLTVEASGGAVN